MGVSERLQGRLDECGRLGERIGDRGWDLAECAAEDAGFPVKITLFEAELASRHLATMAEEMDQVENGSPFGTVGAIFPYDAAVVTLARLGGGCLLSGNRFRFSFSSWTARSARLIAEISSPFEPFEPITGMDNRDFGRHCVNDEAVRVLFISGSSVVGEAYRGLCRSFDKLFFAGPGGMPAAVVFPDADPEAAARFISRRAFLNGGQYCTTIKKALIHESLYGTVRERILENAKGLKVGDPRDADTDIGPIRVARTVRILQNGLNQCRDASLIHGGIDGEWVYPLILEMEEIPDLELFGPFLALKPFTDSREAVREIVKSRYGFLLTYFGTPPEHAEALFKEHFGMIHGNPDFLFTPMRLPFGGKKDSGWILELENGRWVERDGAFLYTRELIRRERART